VWAPDRPQAIARMRRALDELAVLGVATNQAFHRRLFADRAFQDGDLDIQFLERRPDLAQPAPSNDDLLQLAVAAALAEDDARRHRRPAVAGDDHGSEGWSRAARLEPLR
jgi:acetyl/propionyl-CoA carboxylase alpha subunit